MVRERPLSWVDDTFEVAAFKGKKRRGKIRFGDVFFSSRDNPVSVPQLQLPAKATRFMRLKGFNDLQKGSDDQLRALANSYNIPFDQLKLAFF